MDKNVAIKMSEFVGRLVQGEVVSDLEINRFAALALSLVKGPTLGTELFNAIARLSWSIAYEAVVFRQEENKFYVFLKQRSADDSEAPGMWCLPGTIFRPEERKQDVVRRLSKKEFGSPVLEIGEVGFWLKPKRADERVGDSRGSFVHWVHLVRIELGAGGGQWFPVDALPENTVWFHAEYVVPLALAHYKMRQGLF